MSQHAFPCLFLTAILVLLSAAGRAQEAPVSRPIPAEVLFKKQLMANYNISPDGRYFAETIEKNFETDLIIVDIDAHKKLDQIPLGRVKVQNLYWLTPRRLLYESKGEIYAIDMDGSNSSKIVGRTPEKRYNHWRSYFRNFRYNNVLKLLPSQKDEILIETFDFEGNATANSVNIFTGEKTEIANGKSHGVNKWIADFHGDLKLALRLEDNGISYLEYNEQSEKWEPLNILLNGKEYPLSINAESYLDQNLNFEGFDFEKDVIFLSSNILSDKRTLLKYHLKDRKIIETLLEDVNCDVSDPHGAEIRILRDNKNGIIAGLRYESLNPEFRWYSLDFEKVHAALNAKYRTLVHDILDVDAENNRFLIHQWSDNYAGNIGVYTVADSSYAIMQQQNEELNDYNLSRNRNIVVTTRDGHKLPSYLSLPLGQTPGKGFPMVVLPHGGPWSIDYWELDGFSQYFTSRGYATLKVNFRGSTGLGKNHVLAGIQGINTVMIDDIADGVLHVTGNYPVDASRVFIYGHSYGGYATYMSLIRYPGLFASGVAVSAPSDMRSWMRYQKKEDNVFTYEFWKVALGTKSGKELYDMSPIKLAGVINKPLIIAHGELDGIVPVEQAREMADRLQEDRKYMRSKFFQNEGHSGWDSNNLEYLLDLSHEFFLEYERSREVSRK